MSHACSYCGPIFFSATTSLRETLFPSLKESVQNGPKAKLCKTKHSHTIKDDKHEILMMYNFQPLLMSYHRKVPALLFSSTLAQACSRDVF